MSVELTTPIKIEIPDIGTIESDDLYLKSEADKVIAELEEKVDALICSVGVIQEMAEMKSRHHKYKRCLAMAEYCKEATYYFEERLDKCSTYWRVSVKKAFYERWRKRWQELAEKFKEEK